MTTLALLSTALLFGGMVLYSFGFAAFLFTALPAETAGPTIRRAFPHFYLFVIVGAGLSAVFLAMTDPLGAAIMAALESLARANGHDAVELDVSLPSRAFYDRLGYTVHEDAELDLGEGERLCFWRAKKSLLDG